MKIANELRIGNYIKSGDLEAQITAQGILYLKRGNMKAKPIPLTEEWLYKFGFKVGEVEDYFDKNIGIKKILAIHLKDKEFIIGYGIYWTYHFKIKYVHQLQNLYFALTGEELIIKKTTKQKYKWITYQ